MRRALPPKSDTELSYSLFSRGIRQWQMSGFVCIRACAHKSRSVIDVRFAPKATELLLAAKCREGPCVDGSGLARAFFTYAALVGAAMCSAFECGTLGRWP